MSRSSPTSRRTQQVPVSWQMGTPSSCPMRALSSRQSSTDCARGCVSSSRAACMAASTSGRRCVAQRRTARYTASATASAVSAPGCAAGMFSSSTLFLSLLMRAPIVRHTAARRGNSMQSGERGGVFSRNRALRRERAPVSSRTSGRLAAYRFAFSFFSVVAFARRIACRKQLAAPSGPGADGAARWLDRLSPHSLAYSLYAPSSPGETHLMGVFRGECARWAGGKGQGV